MPVSLYGQVADMDEINAIAGAPRLPVIEDAAQSFGASYQGRKSCNLSTFGCTSFFPSKPLGCYGDGGAIFTDDDALAQACREIRVHGQSARYTHTRASASAAHGHAAVRGGAGQARTLRVGAAAPPPNRCALQRLLAGAAWKVLPCGRPRLRLGAVHGVVDDRGAVQAALQNRASRRR